MRDVSYLSLGLSYLLVISFILFVAWKKLGLAKDTLFASIRGVVQLLAVGYAIVWIFEIENSWILIGIIFAMAVIASFVSTSRAHYFYRIWWLNFFTILITSAATIAALVAINAIEWNGKFIIPVAGMVVGQTMTNCSLFLERLLSDIRSHRLLVESNLALGARPYEAIVWLVRRALKAESIPMIDGMKTLGIIYLPGIMAGLIFSGVDPVVAVKYQLVMVFMIAFAFGVSSTILALMVHFFLFNKNYQLREI